ncbi:hypothetical protein BJX63DRAFT_442165 [Aspergillus granulosus]|uniref:Uncharacterized protein n=1 Tax=Aspergillus granulosus TaxID=176169 RepID=A0ABR4GRB4_9EURO
MAAPEASWAERTSSDAASSVYSRGLEVPPLCVPRGIEPTHFPTSHNLPEILLLDHQISQAQGTTMALEITHGRLQAAKKEPRLSLPGTLEVKWRQWKRQEDENRFFRECLRNLDDLTTAILAVTEDLMFSSELEPRVSTTGRKHTYSAVSKLKNALSDSQGREVRAREEWDRRSNRLRIRPISARWI